MTSNKLANTFNSEFKRESLYVYLDQRGCPMEWLNHIKEFYDDRRKHSPVYLPYPNRLDCETHFPFGKYLGKKIDDPEVPNSYRRWLLSQDKMMLSYPLLTNALKKLFIL